MSLDKGAAQARRGAMFGGDENAPGSRTMWLLRVEFAEKSTGIIRLVGPERDAVVGVSYLSLRFFAHRERAARLAQARRSSSVILEKNALAPAPAALSPPSRPRATAAGFFRFAMLPDLTMVTQGSETLTAYAANCILLTTRS